MEQSIWKYELDIKDRVEVMMPVRSRVLSVGNQRETLCLWAIVEPGGAMVKRTFMIKGTGHPYDFRDTAHPAEFLGTVLMHEGALVWHVFDITKVVDE